MSADISDGNTDDPANLLFFPLYRFDSIGTLIKAQAGLHGSAGPRGERRHIKGLYMFGGVGCGKTMLMDLLVASSPKEFQVIRVPQYTRIVAVVVMVFRRWGTMPGWEQCDIRVRKWKMQKSNRGGMLHQEVQPHLGCVHMCGQGAVEVQLHWLEHVVWCTV